MSNKLIGFLCALVASITCTFIIDGIAFGAGMNPLASLTLGAIIGFIVGIVCAVSNSNPILVGGLTVAIPYAALIGFAIFFDAVEKPISFDWVLPSLALIVTGAVGGFGYKLGYRN